jgi:hypothetical protein
MTESDRTTLPEPESTETVTVATYGPSVQLERRASWTPLPRRELRVSPPPGRVLDRLDLGPKFSAMARG